MRIFVLIFILSLNCDNIIGQCPNNAWLWGKLIYLRDSSKAPINEKLTELLKYESEVKRCGNKPDSAHALLYQRIGAAYYATANYTQAAKYMRAAVRLIDENKSNPAFNQRHNIRNYYNLAWINDSLGLSKAKMHAYDSCIILALRFHSVDIYLITALENQVVYFFNVGDYHQCINQSDLCERYSREYAANAGNIDKTNGLRIAIRAFLWKANALLVLKDYEALERLTKDKIDECQKNGFPEYLVTIYSQLAELYLHKNDPKKALAYYEKGFKYAKDTKFDVGCKSILNNIGYNIYYLHLNDKEKALAYCLSALRFLNHEENEKANELFETVNILGNIGNIYATKKNYDSAFYYYKSGLKLVTSDGEESSLLMIPDDELLKQRKIRYVISLLTDKGSAYIEQYKEKHEKALLQKAVQVFRITDLLLTRIRFAQSEMPSKLFWRDDSRRLYERAIEACNLMNDPEVAFYFFEKSRASILADQLTEQQLAVEEEILRIAQIRRAIMKMEAASKNVKSGNVISANYASDVFIARQQLEQLQERIRSKSPLLYQSFLDTNFVTLSKVRKRLLRGQSDNLLEIFWGDSSVYVLIITADEMKLKRIEKARYDQTTSKYIDFISSAEKLNRNFNEFKYTANLLYQMIFQDMPLRAGRFMVSSDGPNFPFEALIVTSAPLTYFLQDHIVSYIHSARLVLNEVDNRSPGTIKFLGMAPLSYSSDLNLPDLPGSDYSLTKISEHFPEKRMYLRERATREFFLKEFEQNTIIHLYTHAADSSDRAEPVIYFADSSLYLSELMSDSRPVTQLVVLSACESGAGRLYRGEGIFSFNRGFAALGIPCSVTNLWSIDNKSTYQLTELFYKYLRKGMPVDEALQKAKLAFMQYSSNEEQLPYYWAATIAAGNAEIKFVKPVFIWKYLIIAGALVTITILLVGSKGSRSSKRES